MNSSASCSLAIMLVGLILISHSPSLASAGRSIGDKGLVGKVCAKMLENENTCMELLKAADPKIVEAKNFEQLSKEVLNFALKKGMDGQAFLKGLAALDKSPAIEQCANFHYDGVVGSFKSAMGELKEDPETANYDAKVASDGSEGCERALANANIVNPAISALNHQITLISIIAFQATSELSQ